MASACSRRARCHEVFMCEPAPFGWAGQHIALLSMIRMQRIIEAGDHRALRNAGWAVIFFTRSPDPYSRLSSRLQLLTGEVTASAAGMDVSLAWQLQHVFASMCAGSRWSRHRWWTATGGRTSGIQLAAAVQRATERHVQPTSSPVIRWYSVWFTFSIDTSGPSARREPPWRRRCCRAQILQIQAQLRVAILDDRR